MGYKVELVAADGFRLDGYRADPSGPSLGKLVVIQEIFGVNHHIKSVVDRYASLGFTAVAPAMFDRTEKGFDIGYDTADFARGREIAMGLKPENTLADIAAAIASLGEGKVGVIGYCFGGSYAWLAATRLKVAAAVSYYGGMVGQFAGETPGCPVIFHFGEKDAHIPSTVWDAIRTAHPELPVYTYDAGHGFNCGDRKDYDATAAALAEERSVAFLKEHLAA